MAEVTYMLGPRLWVKLATIFYDSEKKWLLKQKEKFIIIIILTEPELDSLLKTLSRHVSILLAFLFWCIAIGFNYRVD